MSVGKRVLSAGSGLIDRVLCVAGAIIFSQAPEFIQQYLQRLGGHLDEARRQLQQFKDTAAQSGLTLEQFIHQTNTNADAAVAKLGGVMESSLHRVDTLSEAQFAIQNASVWSRPFTFLQHLDMEIARATWSIYKPAVPTTVEGLIYASMGMAILLLIYHAGIRYPLSRIGSGQSAVPAPTSGNR